MAAFEPAIIQLWDFEVGGRPNGGYTDDPDDPGRETKWGLSLRSYPELDIKAVTEPEAREVYLRDYWNPLLLSQVRSQRVANWIFIWAVNTSYPPGKAPGKPVVAMKHVQEVCNWFLKSDLAVDGFVGPMTLAALNAIPEHRLLVGLFARAAFKRVSRVRQLASQEKYMAGWLRRDMESAGLTWAKEA